MALPVAWLRLMKFRYIYLLERGQSGYMYTVNGPI